MSQEEEVALPKTGGFKVSDTALAAIALGAFLLLSGAYLIRRSRLGH